jgi:hypothetical protein
MLALLCVYPSLFVRVLCDYAFRRLGVSYVGVYACLIYTLACVVYVRMLGFAFVCSV